MEADKTVVTDEMIKKWMQIKKNISELEKEEKFLKPLILADFVEKKRDEVESDLGVISIAYKKKWTYPAELLAREELLDADKKTAEKIGTATFENNPYITFRAAKDPLE